MTVKKRDYKKDYWKTGKKWHQAHREKCRLYCKQFRQRNPDRAKINSKKWREAHPEWTKEYTKKNKERLKKYQKEYNKKNREKLRIKLKKWRKANPDKSVASFRRYIKKYPEKYKAHTIAMNNIKLKNKKCKTCGTKGDLQRHHEDYSKPLDVIILCRGCHDQVHRGDSI